MPKLFLVMFAVLFMLCGCGITSIEYSVKRPAPIGLKGYKRIAIGNFTANDLNHANMVSIELSKKLLDSGYFDKILDRKYMYDVLTEQKLQLSGLIDNRDLSRFGKISGAQVLIYGSVDTDRYQEQKTSRKLVQTNIQNETVESNGIYTIVKKATYQTNLEFIRKGFYLLTVSYQIVDVETSELILVKRFSVEKVEEKTAVNSMPDLINADSLFIGCVEKLTSDFTKQLLPYYETVRADFQTDNLLPDVETAVGKIKAGQYDEAMKIFIGSTNKNGLKTEIRAKTYYNLGVMMFMMKQFKSSRINIEKAIAMNPKEPLYPRTLKMVAHEALNEEKLEEHP